LFCEEVQKIKVGGKDMTGFKNNFETIIKMHLRILRYRFIAAEYRLRFAIDKVIY
jgi:hypothetical protein